MSRVLPVDRWYHCTECDVRGYGSACWYCGTTDMVKGVGVGANPGSGNQWDRHETMEPIVPVPFFADQLTAPPPL